MVSLRKILLPVDYSERCYAVTRQAGHLARSFSAEITVLHVIEPVPDSAAPSAAERERLFQARRAKAEAHLARFAAAELVQVNTVPCLRTGHPAAEILRQAASSATDLIMMPTRGFTSSRLMLLGSVTAKVLQHAPCPVWAGPHEYRESTGGSTPPTHIVCALAFGCGESSALLWAAALAGAFHAAISVLHLAPRAELPGGERAEPWKSHALANDFVTVPLPPQARISHQILVETSDASRAVSALSKRLAADLVILDSTCMGEHGFGSAAYELVVTSDCSILRL